MNAARRRSRVNDTQYAVALDGTAIEFECKKAGHRYREDYGPDAPRKRRIATALLAGFARYWSRENGGCSGECPKCRREELRVARRTNA